MQPISSIILAAGVYPPDVGGPATYAAMIARELPQRGVDVKVVPFHLVRGVPKVVRHITYTYRLFRQTRDVDAVMATDGVSVGLPALLVATLRKRPLIVRLGGDYAWEQGVQRFGVTDTLDVFTKKTPRSYNWQVRFLAFIERRVVRAAAYIVMPSQYMKDIVTSWPGVDPDRVRVVYSVLDPLPVVTPSKTPKQHFTVLTAGRLVPWKGIDGVIRVCADMPDVQLLIAGDGPEKDCLSALADTLGVSDRVKFLGSCSKQALAEALADADVFVLNTAYEGLSHMLLEVMASGVPIVTTDVGGNPELIQDDVSGYLVPVDDEAAIRRAIEEIQTNPQKTQRLVDAAKTTTQQFCTDQSIQALYELLQSDHA